MNEIKNVTLPDAKKIVEKIYDKSKKISIIIENKNMSSISRLQSNNIVKKYQGQISNWIKSIDANADVDKILKKIYDKNIVKN